MKIPLNFRLKCPSLESVTYHCLRILGIFIGVAAIIYFMYDGKIRDSGSKRRAQERLIRRKSESFVWKEFKWTDKRKEIDEINFKQSFLLQSLS